MVAPGGSGPTTAADAETAVNVAPKLRRLVTGSLFAESLDLDSGEDSDDSALPDVVSQGARDGAQTRPPRACGPRRLRTPPPAAAAHPHHLNPPSVP